MDIQVHRDEFLQLQQRVDQLAKIVSTLVVSPPEIHDRGTTVEMSDQVDQANVIMEAPVVLVAQEPVLDQEKLDKDILAEVQQLRHEISVELSSYSLSSELYLAKIRQR